MFQIQSSILSWLDTGLRLCATVKSLSSLTATKRKWSILVLLAP